MDFIETDEQRLVRDMVREFAETELAPIAAEIDRDHRFPAETLPKLAEQGLLGMPWSQEYGGSGMDFTSYAIAIEELSRVCASTGVIVESHTSLATSPINEFGTEEQKRKYLPGLCSGELLGAFGLTEPNAGSDAGATETTAVHDGEGYLLNGQKIFITDATYCDIVIVFARTDPDPGKGTRGISAFIVDKSLEGVSVGAPEDKLGIRGADTAALYFSDVHLPDEALLGQEGEGFRIALATLDGGRVGVAAQAIGIAQGALEASISYAKERVQFGRPIATKQAIQWMLADMSTEIEAARLLTYRAADLEQHGERFGTAAAQAKLTAAQVANKVASAAIQVHGGNGYTTEYPVERAFRDARITGIYEGTDEVQRMVIARALLA